MAVAAALAALMACACAQPAAAKIVDAPVSFQVRNTNTSKVGCPSDGHAYTVRGHLVGPGGALRSRSRNAVTLYYHGLALGEFFWRFRARPGYDWSREMARLGNVSLTVDRLGYDSSGRPPGKQSCYGSQADIAHQIIGQLRRGTYTIARRSRPSFERVVLDGHSAEGYAVEDEAYSYHDVDGLILTSFAEQGQSALTFRLFGQAQARCASGGQRSDGTTGPSGYTFLAPDPADYRAGNFYNADPGVIAAAAGLANRDPCGETSSAPAATAADNVNLRTVAVPVLLVSGAQDALFPPSGVRLQRGLFSGSPDVTLRILADTGHYLTLGRTAPEVRGTVSGWLRDHGFQPQGCPLAAHVLNGTDRGDRLAGTAGADRVLAEGGNDRVRPGSGADCVRGGSGGDRIRGASGADELDGGAGRDVINGDSGADLLHGGSAGDYVSGNSGDDRISGSSGNDHIFGRAGRDRLSGGSGRDRMVGGPGRDVIDGGSGADRILSADGRRDTVRCGRGRDRVRADRFDHLRGCERVRLRRARRR